MKTYSIIKLSFVLIALPFLVSCSATHLTYWRSIQLAFNSPPDISVSTEQILASPSDLIYVKRDDFTPIILALAYLEDGQYTWVSRDGVALREKYGRINRTMGLIQNLDFTKSAQPDPLMRNIFIQNDANWSRELDYSSQYYGVSLTSSFRIKYAENLIIQNKTISTVLIEEEIQLSADKGWINFYWFEQSSGLLVKSEQKIHPSGSVFEIVYLSRALRL
ncbi:MAG: YjbF family lipoprotein [Paraglaciecola sp.]|nr:YjbF family lipoprotein [Paraglaciecola sp.]NCT46697.1 YjbF family lipoprotein [Paraglaciecola sp.]